MVTKEIPVQVFGAPPRTGTPITGTEIAPEREVPVQVFGVPPATTKPPVEDLRAKYGAKIVPFVDLATGMVDVVGALEAGVSQGVLGEIVGPDVVKEQESFRKANVKLDTDEWVDKVKFEALPTEKQSSLRSLGTERFNTQEEEIFRVFQETNVQLDNEEWVDKVAFAALTPEQQNNLRSLGTEKFVAHEEELFRGANVQLGTGEWVDKKAFQEMPELVQEYTSEYGLDALNKLFPAPEEKTFWQKIKSHLSPEYPPHGSPEEQLMLQLQLEAWQAQPLFAWPRVWESRILSFGPPVMYNPDTGLYIKIAYMVAPEPKTSAVSAATAAAQTLRARPIPVKTPAIVQTRTIGASDVGMSQTQFSAFVRARVLNPNLTPEGWKLSQVLGRIPPAQQTGSLKTMAEILKAMPTRPVAPTPQPAPGAPVGPPSVVQYQFPGYGIPTKAVISQAAKIVQAARGAQTIAAPVIKTVGLQFPRVFPGQTIQPLVLTPGVMSSTVGTLGWKVVSPNRTAFISFIQPITISPQTIAAYNSAKTFAAKQQILAKQGLLPATETLTKVKNWAAATTADYVALATHLAAMTIAQAIAQGKTESQAQTAAQAIVKQLASTATAAKTRTQLQAKTASIVSTATSVATDVATAIEPVIATTYKPPPTERPPKKPPPRKRPPPPPPPWPDAEAPRVQELELPQGTIAWRQGAFWRFVLPPWGKQKPGFSRKPPKGAIKTDKKTPEETLQIIGKPGAKVPKSFSVDLGVVDVLITGYGTKIAFKGHGEKTNVGKRIDSTVKGMSVGKEGPVGLLLEPAAEPLLSKAQVKPGSPRGKPKRTRRGLTAWERATTLKGFVP